jgi:hypothetical protein
MWNLSRALCRPRGPGPRRHDGKLKSWQRGRVRGDVRIAGAGHQMEILPRTREYEGLLRLGVAAGCRSVALWYLGPMPPSADRLLHRILQLPFALILGVVTAGVIGFMAVPTESEARGLSCRAQSKAPMRLCGVETDNYKDCYNGAGHPQVETRSWVVWSTLQARAASWKLAPGTPQFGTSARLVRISGRPSLPKTAVMTAETVTGPVGILTVRSGPPTGRWGILLTLSDRDALRAGPAHIRLVVRTTGGQLISSLGLRYAFDSALSSVPSSSPEFNGPGGRWIVHRAVTKTDIEAGVKHTC